MGRSMTMMPAAGTVAPWWKHRWPWLLMMGPALAVVGGGYTGWLAFTREDALVVGDYYKQGRAINQDLRRDHAAAALGMSATIAYDATTGMLAGRVVRNDREPVGSLLLHLSHATLPEKDIKVMLRPNADGSFVTALPMLERSRWTVLLESEQRDWRLAGTWIWPAQHGVTLRADLPEPAPQ